MFLLKFNNAMARVKACSILLNIGCSDLKTKDYDPEKHRCSNFYDYTKRLYSMLERSSSIDEFIESEKVTMPLIEPIVSHITSQNYTVKKVLLFGTEQSPEAYKKDTYYAASVIKRILEARLGCKVFVYKIVERPDDYVAMLDTYNRLFKRLEENREISGDIFVSITGGTPAQNFALFWTAFSFWGDRLKVLYLPKGEKTPKELELVEYFKARLIDAQVSVLEDLGLYLAAAKLYEGRPGAELRRYKLLVAKAHELEFDFDEAIRIYEELGMRDDVERLNRVKSGNYPEDILELLLTGIELKFKQGAYSDALARIRRFLEELLAWLCSRVSGACISKLRRKKINELRDCIELEKFPSEVRHRVGELLGIVDSLRPLIDLRNRSIVGHGTKGLSLWSIAVELRKRGVLPLSTRDEEVVKWICEKLSRAYMLFKTFSNALNH